MIVVYQDMTTYLWPYLQVAWLSPLNHQNEEINKKASMAFAVIYALFGALFFTVESMFIRYLDLKGIPGNISGLCYVLFEGIIGTFCLVVYSCFGHGIFDFTPRLMLWVFAAGLFTTFGLIL